jgi:hypothetical protein
MRRTKLILVAVLAVTLIVVEFQAYSLDSRKTPTATLFFSPSSSSRGNYPNPANPNVTFTGVLTSTVISPTCALNTPPCAMSAGTLYYVTANGVNYRLIFPASMKLPINGFHIMVTGTYVTPSTYHANQWTPQLSFAGDI